MRRRQRRFLDAALACAVAAAPMAAPCAAWSADRAADPVSEDVVRARADALIARMTPEEKAGQLSLFVYTNQAPGLAEPVEKAIATGGASSIYYVSDPAEVNRLQRMALDHSRLKIPMIFTYDVIHGLHTIFPVPLGMAASWDPALVERAQSVAAAEARAVGIAWTFSPMVDIARDPRWGRIVEGAGEDPYLGSAMAVAQVRGFQGRYVGAPGRIIAGPKHFAGYGASLGGRDYDEVNLSDSELWNVYLPPFKASIDAGAANIMSAYMPLNGTPGAGNAWLLTKVLRDTWGFKGFVVTDSNAVNSLKTQGFASDTQAAAVRALDAGVDMELVPPPYTAAMSALPQALKAGQITTAELDNAVRLVLEAKIRMGLFEKPYVDEKAAANVLSDPAHLTLARVAAERSAVLLRNEGALLPLDRKTLKSIAVIGPLADAPVDTLGPWVFSSNHPPAVSLLQGIRAKLGGGVRVDYSEGVRIPPRLFSSRVHSLDKKDTRPPLDEPAEIRRAASLAQGADLAVLVLGETQNTIGEASSRSSLDLPGRQQELLDAVVATGKPVVVLLMSARPLDLKGSKAQAIMDIWYPGSEGGAAVANLLFGDATPGGKLPISWVRDAGQIPNPYAHLISHRPEEAEKRYWNEPNTPTYPFGFGLSYTTFEYSNLHVEKPVYRLGEPVAVTVDLKNTGRRAGDEVAQLYIHQRYGTSARPIRELKGFQRVSLKPGETRTLHFTLTPDDLRYWSGVTRTWVQDASPFDVWVGGDSQASLAGGFEVRKP
jgi:beta-glucosidase